MNNMLLPSGNQINPIHIIVTIGGDGNPVNIALRYTLTLPDGTTTDPTVVDLPVDATFGPYILNGLQGILLGIAQNEAVLGA